MCSKPPRHPHLRAWPPQLHVFRRATAEAQAGVGGGGGAFVSDVAVSFDTQVGDQDATLQSGVVRFQIRRRRLASEDKRHERR
ncbi:hypothetical protein ACFX13_000660 [Malus domestica]